MEYSASPRGMALKCIVCEIGIIATFLKINGHLVTMFEKVMVVGTASCKLSELAKRDTSFLHDWVVTVSVQVLMLANEFLLVRLVINFLDCRETTASRKFTLTFKWLQVNSIVPCSGLKWSKNEDRED